MQKLMKFLEQDYSVWLHTPNGWQEVREPDWQSGRDYHLVPRELALLWQAYLDGELEIWDGGAWVSAQGAPNFGLPATCYRRRQELNPHAKLAKKWVENKGSTVWRKNGPKWIQVQKPRWAPRAEYCVVLPAYDEAWAAWMDGELEGYVNGSWLKWCDGSHPRFSEPASSYRRCLHHKKQREVLEANPSAQVWVKSAHSQWVRTTTPCWGTDLEYKVVPLEYAIAWQAFLDGELQVQVGGTWIDYADQNPPSFQLDPGQYRRKPQANLHYKDENGNWKTIYATEVRYEM